MPKFCPKCGKTITKGTFCKECKAQELNFKEIKIKLCPSKRYFYQGKWKEFKDLKQEIENILQKQLQKKVEAIDFQYEYMLEKPGLERNIDFIAQIDSEEYILPINIQTTLSPTVQKLGSTYYEGIMQVRNASSEVKKYIKKTLEKHKVYVNDVVEKKDSVDFYFVNKQKIRFIAGKIIKKYSGHIDENAQLFSRNHQTSKDIYRLNTLVELPLFKENDVILINESPFLITNLGKINSAFDLLKQKKTAFKYDPNTKYKKIKKETTKIIKEQPEITALHPKTYQEIKVENPFSINLQINKNIKGIIFKQKFFALN
ncbi:MAG: NMD3-related protein [Candidatus Woesearchaeota archaeon]